MTAPTRPRPEGPRRVRVLLVRLWANRPTLGTLAWLLAVPGVARVLVGWPLWWTAAVQWSLWLALVVAISITEARRTDTPPTSTVSAEAAATGEEGDR